MRPTSIPLIPAKAGTQAELEDLASARDIPHAAWAPAFAGVSGELG
jgi:hypothetical protein